MTYFPVTLRPAIIEDQDLLGSWLLQSGVLRWFPLNDQKEIDDAVRIWMACGATQGAGLTALWDGEPCGNATLYPQVDPKLAHQSLFAIIVDEKRRGCGVGKCLIEGLMHLAKERFRIQLLHLEVYEGNPAIHLYERLGFVQYGAHPRFVKEPDGRYLSKVMMQRRL